MSNAATAEPARTGGESRPTPADHAAYWLVTAGLYLTFAFLWYYPAKEKLFDHDGEMPPPLKKVFDGSFLDSVPGLNAAWTILGITQAIVFLTVMASLVTGEFMPARRKPILLTAFGLSMLTFGGMLFAESMVGEFETVFRLFAYFTGTAVLIALVLLMPPYRPARWLSPLVPR